MTPRASWARAAWVLAGVLVADQVAKAVVNAALDRGDSAALVLGIKIVNDRNDGVAFGALQGSGVIVALVIVAAVVALTVYFLTHTGRPLVWLPTGLLLGGALGNVIDRVREGAVVDFLKFPHWPAFNVADAAITMGVVALLYVIEYADGDRGRA